METYFQEQTVYSELNPKENEERKSDTETLKTLENPAISCKSSVNTADGKQDAKVQRKREDSPRLTVIVLFVLPNVIDQ